MITIDGHPLPPHIEYAYRLFIKQHPDVRSMAALDKADDPLAHFNRNMLVTFTWGFEAGRTYELNRQQEEQAAAQVAPIEKPRIILPR